MSKDNAQPITHAEVARLNAEMDKRLMGKRGRLWLAAYKRLLRRQVSFIETTQIVNGRQNSLGSTVAQREYLRRLGVSDFPQHDLAIEIVDQTPKYAGEHEHHVVSVRLGDMFTLEELGGDLKYDTILKHAMDDRGLDPCGLLPGLEAIIRLTELQRGLPYSPEHCKSYVICTHPFKFEDEKDRNVERLPLIAIYPGERKEHQGSMWFYNFNSRLTIPNPAMRSRVNHIENPETEMLFIQSLE